MTALVLRRFSVAALLTCGAFRRGRAVRLAAPREREALMSDVVLERELIVAFVEAADERVQGAGDFDAYHSARHDLVMAIGGDLR